MTRDFLNLIKVNLFFLILLSSLNIYSFSIDGILDEEEWKEARKVSSFLEVAHFTLKETK